MAKCGKYLSALLAVVFAAGSFPIPASAESGENLALGKPVITSSYYAQDLIAKNITDGNYGTIWAQGGFPGDTGKINGYDYVMVDLEDNYWIYNINVIGRPYDNDTYKDIIVEIADNKEFQNAYTVAVGDLPANNYKWALTVESDDGYRYVRLRKLGHFSFSELEVYGEKFDPNKQFVRVFEDTQNSKFEGPARVADSLGILPKSGSYEFGAYYTMTRSDALLSVMRLVGLDAAQAYVSLFEDVGEDHPIAPYLYMAISKGIISQDIRFRPNDYVTVQEYLKMILYALDYAYRVEYYGDWPTGVINTASHFKLMKNVDLDYTAYLNKGNAAIILYNTLQIPRYDESDDILSSIYDMHIIKGILNGNGVTTLISERRAAERSVLIDGNACFDESGFASDLIGRAVIAVVDSSDSIRAVWGDVNKNTVTEIAYNEVEIDGRRIKRVDPDTNKTIKTFTLADKPDVLKNGVVDLSWDMDSFIIPYGTIELIDNDNDGRIDVVLVWEPEIAVMRSISVLSDDSILIQAEDGKRYTFTNPNVQKIVKSGRITTLGRIPGGDLIMIYASDNGENFLLKAFDPKKITGVAGAVGDDSVTVGGVSYRLSDYCKANSDFSSGELMKKKSAYYLDENNNVVVIIKDNGFSDGETLGFIQKVYADEDDENALYFRIFTQNQEFLKLDCASRMKVDGVSRRPGEFAGNMTYAKSYFEGGFALFKLDEQGKIISMDTENYDRSKEADSRIRVDITMHPATGVFLAQTNGFYQQSEMITPCDRDTTAFSIPSNGEGSYARGSEYDKLYRVRDVENIFPNMQRMPDGAYAKVYGQDKNRQPLFLAQFAPYVEADSSDTSGFIDDYKAPGMIIDKVIEIADNDGIKSYMLKGYQLNKKGVETSVVVDSSIEAL